MPTVPATDSPVSYNLTSPYNMLSINARSEPIMIPVSLNNNHLDMELDTGAAVSVISATTFHAVLKDPSIIRSSDLTLRTYLGKELPVLGTVQVTVSYESQKASLPLVIVKGQGASLFGQNW